MLQYYDPTGFARTAKACTKDGDRYPCRMVAAWRMKPIKWTDGPTPPAQVLDVPMVVVHCGPDAPYPRVPTPEQILESVRWTMMLRTDEERELRLLTAEAEREF